VIISPKGPSIKYVTQFWTNFEPLFLSHIVTHLGTPIFSSTCIHTYVFIGTFVLVRGGSCLEGFVRGFFVWKVLLGVVFVRPPSVRIHPLQQKAKHHFQFVVSYVWKMWKVWRHTLCHKLSHLLGPPRAWLTLWMAPKPNANRTVGTYDRIKVRGVSDLLIGHIFIFVTPRRIIYTIVLSSFTAKSLLSIQK